MTAQRTVLINATLSLIATRDPPVRVGNVRCFLSAPELWVTGPKRCPDKAPRNASERAYEYPYPSQFEKCVSPRMSRLGHRSDIFTLYASMICLRWVHYLSIGILMSLEYLPESPQSHLISPTSIDPSNSPPFDRYHYPFALQLSFPASLTPYSSVASLANPQPVLRPRVRPPGSCLPSCGPCVLRHWDGRVLSSLFSKHQLQFERVEGHREDNQNRVAWLR